MPPRGTNCLFHSQLMSPPFFTPIALTVHIMRYGHTNMSVQNLVLYPPFSNLHILFTIIGKLNKRIKTHRSSTSNRVYICLGKLKKGKDNY